MRSSECMAGAVLLLTLGSSPAALAQSAAAAKGARVLSEKDVRDVLIFNSPWESRSTTPGQLYRYRTNFIVRGQDLVAQITRYSNNEQGDSIVSMKEGRVIWQDPTGADVVVTIDGEDLVGTATSKTSTFNVLFKPRP